MLATGSGLTVVGGYTASGASSSVAASLNPARGTTTYTGSLATPTHDAAAATIGGRVLIFGGGTGSSSSAAVQESGGGGWSTIGSLPTPRSDGLAVVLGSSAYILGGYNGTSALAQILVTSDGVHFATVGTLPLPVRYPAGAVDGSTIYLFGGETVNSAGVSTPTAAIQAFNTVTGSASIVGQMPAPVMGAAAALLGSTVYIAGGTRANSAPSSSIFAWQPGTTAPLLAGHLQQAVANAGAAVLNARLWLVGGETSPGNPTTAVQVVSPNASFGSAGNPGAGSPFYGDRMLIADQANGRLLLINAASQIVWSYPGHPNPTSPTGFAADDAFFANQGHMIVVNEENRQTVEEISFPGGKVLWSYGHPGIAGSAPGYLNTPDDAYLLRNGDITTADIANCRILLLSPATGRIVSQIGRTGVCYHHPSPPVSLGSPNGDTPLADGNLLVSEINGGWVDEITLQGKVLWSVQLGISYPSDPQQLGPNKYLIADYTNPGQLLMFNRQGQILWRYRPQGGIGALNHPSLAEMLPNGILMLNDDGNNRMVAIDPATSAVVWQYGVQGVAGSAPGYLSEPDGFDIITPEGTTPTHPSTA